ncbi:hypothetical protein DV735_g5287, partial [Chaetothyriales sp. CBS 134920]
MGEKKRKDLPTGIGSEGPKKTKKVKIVAEPTPAPGISAPAEAPITTKATKKGRRGGDKEPDSKSAGPPTAADKAPPSKSSGEGKKKKETKSKRAETLTADGANGIIEHAETEVVEPTPGSMQAEAQRTVDTELREEYEAGDVETAETENVDAALLAGFDSDTSDHAEDTGLDVNNLGGIPQYKKTKKKLSKITKSGKPGVVYIGRIPHGFYEHQMQEYFSQFGEVTRLRLSRNRRTGASKHFAFIEFASEEVAKIVAETMDNYLMFGHILKCKYAPVENLHPDVWKGAGKKFRKIPHGKLERQKLEASKTVDEWKKKNEKEAKKRSVKAKALKEKLGYEAPIVQLAEPEDALMANKEEAEKAKAIEAASAEAGSTAAIEAPTKAATGGEDTAPTPETADDEPAKAPAVNLDAKAAPESDAVPATEPEIKKAGKKADKKEAKVEKKQAEKKRGKKAKTQV